MACQPFRLSPAEACLPRIADPLGDRQTDLPPDILLALPLGILHFERMIAAQPSRLLTDVTQRHLCCYRQKIVDLRRFVLECQGLP